MTRKLDMLVRQRSLLDSLDDNTVDINKYMESYGIREKTVERDFKALADRGELFTHKVNILRKKCLGHLTKKATDGTLSDSLMVNIVMSGVSQKHEIKEEKTVLNKHVEEINVTLRNYEDTVQKVLSRYVQPNNPP
jgi:hypothetical protein